MTHLRKMMLEELERRNYAQTTIDCYIQTVEDFARYFRRPPDQLAPEHIREYQAYLFRDKNTTPAQHLEPRRSRPPHRFLPDSVSSRCTDDALWHGGTACRVDSLAN